MPRLPTSRGPAIPAADVLTNALIERGRSAFQREQFNEAVQIFRRVLTAKGPGIDPLGDLAMALFARGDLEEALQRFSESLAISPRQPGVWQYKGMALARLGRADEALVCFARMIAIAPNVDTGYIYRANTLTFAGRYREALAAYDAIPPGLAVSVGIPLVRGVALQWVGRFAEAQAELDRAIAMAPGSPFAYFNKGMLLLLRGDLPGGLKLLEKRWEAWPGRQRRSFATPLWLGETSLAGKTLFVDWEQGLGDTIQFSRYIPMAEQAGATVIFEPQAALSRLMETLPGGVRLVPDGAEPPPHDFHCPIMSLPLAFGTTQETIPGGAPYLQARKDLAAIWRDRLTGLRGPRIGLVWGGGSRLGNAELVADDKRRSVPLAAFGPLAAVPGAHLFSLQLGPPAAQAAHPPKGMVLLDHTGELKDFTDTAALIENLDLVISVDTSVAHLAGALGKPVWLLNRFDTDWRWFLQREDTDWYPSMRIFRQPASGDWASVLQAVAAALRRFMADRPTTA